MEITDFEQAKQIALRRLSVRARSSEELRRDLIARDVSATIADEIVTCFLEVGLLDDEDFAKQWVTSRRRTKSLSSSALRCELSEKGIIVSDEVMSHCEESDEDVAVNLARARAAIMVGKDRTTMMRRLIAQLERRGFTESVIRKTVMQVMDELGSITDDE